MTVTASVDRAKHQRFRFRTADALRVAARQVGVELPWQDDVRVLLEPVRVGESTSPNRLAIQPMEGLDAEANGAPSEATRARYEAYARGGSGLIWFEATSVVPAGRSNLHQLMITRANVEAFGDLVQATRVAAERALGRAHRPILVLQLTHSGRFSVLGDGGQRRVACANPHLDRPGETAVPWRDEELDGLVEYFVEAARLADEAGFDIVDIKVCHGYLLHELLGARTRASRYGGSFENRARFLLDVARRLRREGLAFGVRLNATDHVPHPYGFGMAQDGSLTPDLAEPLALVRQLRAAGCVLLNVTAGIPAFEPHVGRPFDRPVQGAPVPPEHPLVGVGRLLTLTGELQRHEPALPVVGTGYSWLRQFWPNVGAAAVSSGQAALVGIGRGAFAYPDAPMDLMHNGRLESSKCCVGCSHCSQLMRAKQPAHCVVRKGR